VFREESKKSTPKAPTKTRLRNIALYYLERFESSEDNLRMVLKRRIDKYCLFNKEYSPQQAYQWVEEIVDECLKHNFVNDERFAEIKISAYLNAGKPRRYIEQKLKAKGIDDGIIERILTERDYSEREIAFNFAQKKKIGRFRLDAEERIIKRQKDMGTLLRAGFNYDIVKEILDGDE